MSTRYYLRGPRGYVSGIRSVEWTLNPYHAHSWVTSEAAHEAANRWFLVHGDRLTVELRSTNTPFSTLAPHP